MKNMYKTTVQISALIVILNHSISATMDTDEVRAPFGPKMCVEWCQRLQKCRSPIFVIPDLSCHFDRYSCRPLNASGMYMITVNKTPLPGNSGRQETTATGNSKLVKVPDGAGQNVKTSIYLLTDTDLLVYAPVIRSWRVVRKIRRNVMKIAGGGGTTRLYYLVTDGQRYNISYYNVNNPTEPSPIVGHGRLELTVEMAVDEGAGLIFLVSVNSTGLCRLLVFKNKEISKNIILEMHYFGNVDIDRVHRKLYIAYTWPDTAYVGKVDYDGWVCDKIRLPGQYPVPLAYDARDDVVYGLVSEMGNKRLYVFDFKNGSKRWVDSIPGDMKPNIILISLRTLALIDGSGAVLYDRNLGTSTYIAGRSSKCGVILGL